MKRLLILSVLLCIAALLAFGGWLLLRRTPGGPGEDTPQALFATDVQGVGLLTRLADTQTPLRTFRWIRHRPGAWNVGQLLTQADRQRVVLMRDGRPQEVLAVPRPEGVEERFFRFAVLQDALALPDGVLVLSYAPHEAGTDQLPLTMALEPTSRALRWHHRAPGTRLALGRNEREAAVFLWGSDTPVCRLPLAKAGGETSFRGQRSTARTVELPPEIQLVSDLVATGPWAFLLAHRKGLAAHLGSKGWQHQTAPEPDALGFPEGQGRLARGRGAWWWQPRPGQLLQVAQDASSTRPVDPSLLTLPESAGRDGRLLNLLGCDAEGALWFGLAVPVLPTAAAAPAPAAEEGWRAEGDPTPGQAPPGLPFPEREAWQTYLQGPMDRLYRWDPAQRRLQTCAWSKVWPALGAPPDIPPPKGDAELRPDASGLLLGEGGRVLWIPLSALPLEPLASPDSRTGSSR